MTVRSIDRPADRPGALVTRGLAAPLPKFLNVAREALNR